MTVSNRIVCNISTVWLPDQELEEQLDASIAGITLDQYMSSLVTTPASLAATSGLGQRFPLQHLHTGACSAFC